MKVEILTSFTHKGENFILDDQRTVSDADGEYFCRAGWARDLSGTIPTGNPGPADVVLEVQDTSVSTHVQLAE